MLLIDEAMIRRVAKRRLQHRGILRLSVQQMFFERWTRLRTHLSFRSRQNEGATAAYGAMTTREFEGINARQRWANWRTIPRNLSGQVSSAPLRVLDLCCGVGHSTEVLACFLGEGSRILGIEFNERFVEFAKTRRYERIDGKPVLVSFRAQSVLESFCDEYGHEIASGSVDLVNSCGAVAHHFDSTKTAVVAREIARVLKPGAIAMVDAGQAGTDYLSLLSIFRELGFDAIHEARSCLIDRAVQVCFKKRV